jgi:hypothetical protein
VVSFGEIESLLNIKDADEEGAYDNDASDECWKGVRKSTEEFNLPKYTLILLSWVGEGAY